jgi:hypothetical protein
MWLFCNVALFLKFCWHASKWSFISFSHWPCPSDRDFSFPRFVGLLKLSLWFYPLSGTIVKALFSLGVDGADIVQYLFQLWCGRNKFQNGRTQCKCNIVIYLRFPLPTTFCRFELAMQAIVAWVGKRNTLAATRFCVCIRGKTKWNCVFFYHLCRELLRHYNLYLVL